MLACSDSPFGKHIFERINNLYGLESGSHECSNSVAHKSLKPTISTLEHGTDLRSVSQNSRKRFRSSLCHHIGAETRNPKLHHLSFLNQLRALNGPLLWLCMQCLPQLLAALSLLMGQTPQATVDTIYEVNKLARKATAWARTPLKIHAHHSPIVVTYTDAGWTTRPDGTSQGGQLVFIANSELLQGRESNMSLISWHSSRLRLKQRRTANEAVYIRLCLKEVLFGQLDLRNWQSEARQIPAALVWSVVVSTTPWLALRHLVLV